MLDKNTAAHWCQNNTRKYWLFKKNSNKNNLKHSCITCSRNQSNKERVSVSQRYFAVLTMLIFTKTCSKNRNGATSCFISYLRLLYDQYCQLTFYRLKPLRNSGVVHADGTGTWPAGEIVIAVNFMSKFFFPPYAT